MAKCIRRGKGILRSLALGVEEILAFAAGVAAGPVFGAAALGAGRSHCVVIGHIVAKRRRRGKGILRGLALGVEEVLACAAGVAAGPVLGIAALGAGRSDRIVVRHVMTECRGMYHFELHRTGLVGIVFVLCRAEPGVLVVAVLGAGRIGLRDIGQHALAEHREAVVAAFLIQVEVGAELGREVRSLHLLRRHRGALAGSAAGIQIVAVGHTRAPADSCAGRALDRARIVAVADRRGKGRARTDAADTGGIGAGRLRGSDRADVVAVGDDHLERLHAADDTGDLLLTGHVRTVPAAVDRRAVVCIAGDTADPLFAACRHIAGHAEAADRGLRAQIAEQAHAVLCLIDVQAIDRMVFAVKAAVELVGAAADRSPVEAGEIDIVAEHGADRRLTAVDRIREPLQLRAGLDLIDAVDGCRHRTVAAVPVRIAELLQRDLLRELVGLGPVRTAQREAAHGAGIAVLAAQIAVGAEIERIAAVRIRRDQLAGAVAQLQRRIQRRAAFIAGFHSHGEDDRAADRNPHVRIMVHVVVDRYGVEVRADAVVRHVVEEGKRVRGGIHVAEGEAVRRRDIGHVLAVRKADVLRERELQRAVVHLLVLAERALDLGAVHIVGRLEVRRVEHAGDLIDRAEHAAEGQADLIAGLEDRLVGEGRICHRDRDLRRAHKAVGNAARIIRHAQDDRAALAVAERLQCGQRDGIAAVLRGERGVLAQGGDHVVRRRHERIFHAARALEREGQHRGLLVRVIVPGIVVVVPVGGTGRRCADGDVVINICVQRTGGRRRAGHDDHAHALRGRRREVAAVGAVGIAVAVHRTSFDRVVADRDDGILRAGGDVRPVGRRVATVHGHDIRVAGQRRPVEVGLDHNVARVGVDELPVAVGAHASRAVKGQIAPRVEVDLDVALIALARLRAELAEIVAEPVGLQAVPGQRQGRIAAGTAEPAGPGHIALAAHAPGVVAVALGNLVDRRLRAAVHGPAVHGFHFGGVEVVPLEVEAELRVRRDRHGQLHRRVDRTVLGARPVAGLEGLVDALREDVAVRIGRIQIEVIQAGIAARVEHDRIIGVIALLVCRAVLRRAAHDRGVKAQRVLIFPKIGVVHFSGVGIEAVAL